LAVTELIGTESRKLNQVNPSLLSECNLLSVYSKVYKWCHMLSKQSYQYKQCNKYCLPLEKGK